MLPATSPDYLTKVPPENTKPQQTTPNDPMHPTHASNPTQEHSNFMFMFVLFDVVSGSEWETSELWANYRQHEQLVRVASMLTGRVLEQLDTE